MDFHVVHIQYRGRHRGYEIWHRNRPFIVLGDGLSLKRREAYAFVRSLNRAKAVARFN